MLSPTDAEAMLNDASALVVLRTALATGGSIGDDED